MNWPKHTLDLCYASLSLLMLWPCKLFDSHNVLYLNWTKTEWTVVPRFGDRSMLVELLVSTDSAVHPAQLLPEIAVQTPRPPVSRTLICLCAPLSALPAGCCCCSGDIQDGEYEFDGTFMIFWWLWQQWNTFWWCNGAIMRGGCFTGQADEAFKLSSTSWAQTQKSTHFFHESEKLERCFEHMLHWDDSNTENMATHINTCWGKVVYVSICHHLIFMSVLEYKWPRHVSRDMATKCKTIDIQNFGHPKALSRAARVE